MLVFSADMEGRSPTESDRRARRAVHRLLEAFDRALAATEEVVAARKELSCEVERLNRLRLVTDEGNESCNP